MNAKVLIEATGLGVSIDGRVLLEGVDVTLHGREIVTLIGPNGAGKTTLLRALLSLMPISAGQMTHATDACIGYVPQRVTVDASLPLSARRFLTLPRGVKKADAEAMAETVGIDHRLDAAVHTLSGGEMQRLVLARALLRRPNLLFLDEPTQGLDFAGEQDFYRLIADLRDAQGVGILMVSHDLHVVMKATDRVLCLNRHVCCSGSPAEIQSHESYRQLFGPMTRPYVHTHDHRHGPDGAVIQPNQGHQQVHGEGAHQDVA